MTSTDDLVSVLKKLRLSGVLLTLPLRIRQAVEENLDHQEFLYRLLHDETERRDGKQLDLRLGRANFEQQKTMEDFDFHFNPGVPRSQVIELATCGFVGRHEVVLLLGATGVGKSHLAQALGHRAVRHGHTVLYTGANALFAQLRAARGDGSFDRRMLKYTSPDLLIIGHRPVVVTDHPARQERRVWLRSRRFGRDRYLFDHQRRSTCFG